MQNNISSPPYKSGAPIAQVLNTEEPRIQTPQSPGATLTSSTTPFSGRLVDLLLDSPEPALGQNKNEQRNGESRPVGSNSSVRQLPKLPQLPQKTTRRPRIPPLLQGLHQPPPLPPSGRLFPPITSEESAFARESSDRGDFDTHSDAARSKGEDNFGAPVFDSLHISDKNQKQREVRQDIATSASQGSTGIEEPTQVDLPSSKLAPNQETSRSKHGRKRRKWSEQETKDLLVGVSRFGIGNWKKILQSPDYQFDRRTAVDLKDRFRVCCPGKGPTSRHLQRDEVTAEQEPVVSPEKSRSSRLCSKDGRNAPRDGNAAQSGPNTTSKQSEHGTNTVHPKLAELGIVAPFTNKRRRARRLFSAEDDKNLLKGFEKYGPVWHSMRDDPELGFDIRHSTDLRDRFRIKFPEKYVKAGHKLKSSKEQSTEEQRATHSEVDRPPLQSSERAPQVTQGVKNTSRVNPPTHSTHDPLKATPSNLRPHELMPYLFNPLPPSLDEHVDAYYGPSDESSITLNRDILQWADAHPLLSTFAPPRAHTHTHTHTHTLTLTPFIDTAPHPQPQSHPPPLFLIDDGLHINPLATVKRPFPDPPPPRSYTSRTLRPSVDAAVQDDTPLDIPRTPNLPTIVFPHVPVASARSTLHNLPTPADLLLGMELERQVVQQGFGAAMALEDVFGFGMGS